jgi:hypothetical protein
VRVAGLESASSVYNLRMAPDPGETPPIASLRRGDTLSSALAAAAPVGQRICVGPSGPCPTVHPWFPTSADSLALGQRSPNIHL